MNEPLVMLIERSAGEVSICASVRPELQCFCLEHEWRVRIEGPRGFLQEWGWRAKPSEEGYRGFSMRWKPPEEGAYKVSVELVSHNLRAEGAFTYSTARVAIVYYSKTGVTRSLAAKLADELRKAGVSADVYEIKVRRDYARPLHINPRLVFETLKGYADIVVDFDPCAYPVVAVASPIWIGRPAAPVSAFLKFLAGKCPGKPVACITTSAMAVDYSVKLAEVAEKLGLRVVFRASAPRGELRFSVEGLAKAVQM